MLIKIVLVTCPDPDEAAKMARELVEAKLAACVNILPSIRSIYFWEGKVQDDGESLLIIKSSEEKIAELEKKVMELHSYDTPEFIALKPDKVGAKYAQWVDKVLGS